MSSTITVRIASFCAACVMTLTLLAGVNSMATSDTAPLWIAKASVPHQRA